MELIKISRIMKFILKFIYQMVAMVTKNQRVTRILLLLRKTIVGTLRFKKAYKS